MKKLLAIVLLLCFSPFAQAQTDFAKTLTVDVSEFKPNVIKQSDGTWTGFDVELWEAIAAESGLSYKYKEVDSIARALLDVNSGDANVALSGITITAGREMDIDFSMPYQDSGLKIAVQESGEPAWSLWDFKFVAAMIKACKQPAVAQAAFALFLVIVVFAHVIWLTEKEQAGVRDQVLAIVTIQEFFKLSTSVLLLLQLSAMEILLRRSG